MVPDKHEPGTSVERQTVNAALIMQYGHTVKTITAWSALTVKQRQACVRMSSAAMVYPARDQTSEQLKEKEESVCGGCSTTHLILDCYLVKEKDGCHSRRARMISRNPH